MVDYTVSGMSEAMALLKTTFSQLNVFGVDWFASIILIFLTILIITRKTEVMQYLALSVTMAWSAAGLEVPLLWYFFAVIMFTLQLLTSRIIQDSVANSLAVWRRADEKVTDFKSDTIASGIKQSRRMFGLRQSADIGALAQTNRKLENKKYQDSLTMLGIKDMKNQQRRQIANLSDQEINMMDMQISAREGEKEHRDYIAKKKFEKLIFDDKTESEMKSREKARIKTANIKGKADRIEQLTRKEQSKLFGLDKKQRNDIYSEGWENLKSLGDAELPRGIKEYSMRDGRIIYNKPKNQNTIISKGIKDIKSKWDKKDLGEYPLISDIFNIRKEEKKKQKRKLGKLERY